MEERIRPVVRALDRLADWSGELFCWLIVPLVVSMTYEVIARYAFHAATIWSYNIAYMMYGSHFMLGAAYTLLRGGHIRTDICYMNWSPRTKGIVDASLYLFLFFPGMALFFWMGLQEALHSCLVPRQARPDRKVVGGMVRMEKTLGQTGLGDHLRSSASISTGSIRAKVPERPS